MTTMPAKPTVFVVDDDSAMRDSLRELIEATDLLVESYASAEEFVEAFNPDRPGCLLLDVCMPGMSGLELQEKLKPQENDIPIIPIIIITGYGDVPMAVRSFRQGAMEFIEKPFDGRELLACIRTAMEKDTQERSEKRRRIEIENRISRLSLRERQVMDLVLAGCANKQIAIRLGIAQRTVEDHRAHIMEKMEVDSVAQLARWVFKSKLDDRDS